MPLVVKNVIRQGIKNMGMINVQTIKNSSIQIHHGQPRYQNSRQI